MTLDSHWRFIVNKGIHKAPFHVDIHEKGTQDRYGPLNSLRRSSARVHVDGFPATSILMNFSIAVRIALKFFIS